MFLVYLIVLLFSLSIFQLFMHLFGAKTVFTTIAIFILVWLALSFWYVVVPVAILIAIIWFIVWIYDEKAKRKKAEEARRRAEEARRRAEEVNRLLLLDINQTGFWNFTFKGVSTTNKNDTDKILGEIIKHPIIIDTNIWMDSELDCFWHDLYMQCSNTKQKVVIPSSVYDEVIRQKDDYNQDKKFKARLALRRIMKFSDSGLLYIYNIKKVLNPYAYADIDIINMCEYIQDKTNQKMFSLITNDKDLIIRTRHILNENKINGEVEICKILSVGPTKYIDKWDEYKSIY